MKKTAHRLLHDALSKEDYARVLINMRNEDAQTLKIFLKSKDAHQALDMAFDWGSFEGRQYWQDVYDGMGSDKAGEI